MKLTNCFSIDLLGRYSAAPLESYKHPYQLVASAGSLAVILQPAFVPFVRAVDYLPCAACLCLSNFSVLLKKLPMYFAADVENWNCCFLLKFYACVFVSHQMLKIS